MSCARTALGQPLFVVLQGVDRWAEYRPPFRMRSRQYVGVSLAEQQKRRRAKREAIAVMEEVASAGATIPYAELAQRIHTLNYAPNGSAFSQMLCDVSRASHARGGIMLSAVVVHADDDLPGEGFFSLAGELGHVVTDERVFHQDALHACHNAYQSST